MRISIGGRPYIFSDAVLCDEKLREGYFLLAQTIYSRLDFGKWYRTGYWDDKFVPYVLYDGDIAVSSVGVCINEVMWRSSRKTYAQISTVMTLPAYRCRGLSRWLMEFVINEWKDKCDAVYLLANDSVVDFYPKFGFTEYTEYDFTIPINKSRGESAMKSYGEFTTLNVEDPGDMDLLIQKHIMTNPFTELKVINLSQFLFHCMFFVPDCIYYLMEYDAVAIILNEGKKMVCYDVFAGLGCRLGDILGVLATNETEYAYLGFTPTVSGYYTAVASQEEDNHLFVLEGKDNIFKTDKIMFPLLSRA